MSAPKPLKSLPGFDEAFTEALDRKGDKYPEDYPWHLLGDVVVPGLHRVVSWSDLVHLCSAIGCVLYTQKPRLRLVPPPRLAANDCEASQ